MTTKLIYNDENPNIIYNFNVPMIGDTNIELENNTWNDSVCRNQIEEEKNNWILHTCYWLCKRQCKAKIGGVVWIKKLYA